MRVRTFALAAAAVLLASLLCGCFAEQLDAMMVAREKGTAASASASPPASAEATPSPTPQPTAEPTPTPKPARTPRPTASPKPSATAVASTPTPKPATPVPTVARTAAPTPAPTPKGGGTSKNAQLLRDNIEEFLSLKSASMALVEAAVTKKADEETQSVYTMGVALINAVMDVYLATSAQLLEQPGAAVDAQEGLLTFEGAESSGEVPLTYTIVAAADNKWLLCLITSDDESKQIAYEFVHADNDYYYVNVFVSADDEGDCIGTRISFGPSEYYASFHLEGNLTYDTILDDKFPTPKSFPGKGTITLAFSGGKYVITVGDETYKN